MPRPIPRLACSLTLLAAGVGSGCCLDYWGEVEEQARLADVVLVDVEQVGTVRGKLIAYGSAGLIVFDGERLDLGTTADFRGSGRDWYGDDAAVVGSLGTIALYSEAGEGWTLHQAPTDATLLAAGFRGRTLVAVGDGVVATLDTQTESVAMIEAPEGDWGSLRTVVADVWTGSVVLAGDEGVAWLVLDGMPIESAQRLDLGIDSDIRAGGYHEDDEHFWLVGEDGLALREDSIGVWRQVDAGTSADFVDFAAGVALTSEGELWDPAQQRRIADVPWARGIGEGHEGWAGYDDYEADPYQDPDALIVGDSGRFALLDGC
jgi:hypothetical protein